MFADLRQHGHTRWKYDLLLRTSLMWMVSEKRTWRRRFQEVRAVWLTEDTNTAGLTFEGFLKAVRREYKVMTERMTRRLRSVMFQIAPRVRQIAGRDVFAVDGTSLELPRTRANQKHFCGEDVDVDAPDENRWKLTPQMHLTALWHVALQLPWDWRAAPGDTAERSDLRDMAASLPENALVVGDAGFVGYELWTTLLEADVDIVVRVGSNVHLIENLEPTDRDDLVWYWPTDARKDDHPPRLLRLVKTKLAKTDAYIVTNVRDADELSDADVVSIYKSRWGVEVFYRGLKQTFARRRLKGRCPQSARAELDLSMLSLWLLHLAGLRASSELNASRPSVPPLSTVGLLDAFRDALAKPEECPFTDETLDRRLRRAHVDSYHRKGSKRSRRYPRKVKQKKCGSPTIRDARTEEKNKLKTLVATGVYRPIAV